MIDGLDLVDIAADLGDPPLGAHSRRGREVQLQRGVGEHDRADVAALDHPAPALGRPLPLAAHAARRAPRLLAATALTAVGDLAAADLGRGVDAVDEHAVRRRPSQVERLGQLGDVVRRRTGRARAAARRT